MTDDTAQQFPSETNETLNEPVDTSFLQENLPVSVLKLLLDRLNITVQLGALTKACTEADSAFTGTAPTQRLGFVFNQLQLKGIQSALLRWRRFAQLRLPAMLYFNQQWQLVERAQDGLLTLTNSEGVKAEYNEFQLESGTVLWLRTATQQEEPSLFGLKDNTAARLVMSEVFRKRRWVFEVAIATLVVNILAVTTSLFAMQVYDRVVPTLAYATLWTLVTGMGIVIVLDWLLKGMRARTLDSVSCAVDKAVSQKVFDHVMHLQLDTRPRSLGTLAAQVGGLDSVRQFFTSGIIFALIDMPFAIIFVLFIWFIGGPIAFVYIALVPLALALGWVTQRRLRNLMKHQMMRSNERQGMLVDAVQGTESIRSNNASWRFSEEWKEITSTITRYNIQQKAISSLATVSTGSLSNAAYVCAIVVGVYQVAAGDLTMGAMIACSILGGRVIAPVAQSVQHLSGWQSVVQALQMVSQVLNLNKERELGKHLLMPDQPPSSIALESVHFSYPESPVKQLDVGSLSFSAGERVVLLGSVGSGKSTLLKVLAGLYRPSAGRVRLGDADLWEVEPAIVADQVAYLPQSVHLFKGSLRSNLTLSGAVGDSHLLSISKELGIDRIAADSPQGMDLPISEGGEGLSGGQRQLLGLGRLLLSQPKIWLLDEPTASLDNESEAQVLSAISKHVKDDDILLISTHRPALAAKLANRVLIMQRGAVVLDGKPEKVIPEIMKRQAGKVSSDKHQSASSNRALGYPNEGPNNAI